MIYLWLKLICMLIFILMASELFTNALEHIGHQVKISAGMTGSILAAVATALPETTVPVMAMIAGTANHIVNEQISVGAILGSSLMLSTLSTCLMAISAIKKRGLTGKIKPEKIGFIRDLNFFLVAFFLAWMAMYTPLYPIYWRASISSALICIYIIYITLTLKASKQLVREGHGVTPDKPIVFTKIGLANNSITLTLQLILSLILLLGGAKGFIDGVQAISLKIHISALILALVIIPIATELPEKVNSIIWVDKHKDTLGFGNITGAMVFQGTLLPALGIMLTPWQPSRVVLTGISITFLAAAWLRINASNKGLRIAALLVNGCLYLTYLGLIFI
jgi:cation:H+ antiporter